MSKLPQPNTNLQKQKQRQRTDNQKKPTVKKNIDPGRPVSRPQAPPPKDTNWGKTLTKPEWVKLMKKLDAKKKAREANKIAEKKK